ncbi:hypothetical protein ACFSCX_22120 [Bacillus salitolerans]|uniref:Uncharacterized protein n=1 Tax=Bacillus salitolerans TaxID=1437434 RepID=A0ABW4LYA5_9BACI
MNNNIPFFEDSFGNIWHRDFSPVDETASKLSSDFTETDLYEEFENESNFFF